MEVQMNSRTESCSVTYDKSSIYPRLYAIINTTLYPSDKFGVITCPYSALGEYGFSDEEMETLGDLSVAEQYESEDYGKGCIVVRIG